MLQHKACLLILLVVLSTFSVALGNLKVGIEKGNWIEYNVTYTGVPTQSHDVNWARMEVLNVQGPNILVLISSKYSDGSIQNVNYSLNLETGHLIDNFIIPADLNRGDSFYAENFGEITISKVENREYTGSMHTILCSSFNNNTYFWDQATGVSVEGITQTEEYTIHTIVTDTNMWISSFAGVFDFSSIFLVSSVLLIFFIAGILAILRYLKMHKERK